MPTTDRLLLPPWTPLRHRNDHFLHADGRLAVLRRPDQLALHLGPRQLAHDAVAHPHLPQDERLAVLVEDQLRAPRLARLAAAGQGDDAADRKSTRLNSSHLGISYAVFCLKKKKKAE